MNNPRSILSVLIIIILCLELIPGNMWFIKLWCGAVLGALFANTVEIIFRYRENRSILKSLDIKTDTKFRNSILLRFVGSIIFSLVSVFVLIPIQVAENTHKDMLVTSVIQEISIHPKIFGEKIIVTTEDLIKIQNIFKRTKVYYPSHVSGGSHFILELTIKGNELTYEADIPNNGSRDDVRLSYKNLYTRSNLLIPGLGKFLKEGLYLNDT